jgi:hypothetical protein
VADFLRIPDVPAYVSHAVVEAFPPDSHLGAQGSAPQSGLHAVDDESEPEIIEVVAEIVDEARLAYAADVVEVQGPGSLMRPPMRSGIQQRSLESAPTIITANTWFED